MRALPNANVSGLTSFDQALVETEKQVRLLAEYARECPQMTVADRQMLVNNIDWLRGYYVQLEKLCLEALTPNE